MIHHCTVPAPQPRLERQDNVDKFADRPNLLRVATELAKCKDPDRVLETLRSVLNRQGPNLPSNT